MSILSRGSHTSLWDRTLKKSHAYNELLTLRKELEIFTVEARKIQLLSSSSPQKTRKMRRGGSPSGKGNTTTGGLGGKEYVSQSLGIGFEIITAEATMNVDTEESGFSSDEEEYTISGNSYTSNNNINNMSTSFSLFSKYEPESVVKKPRDNSLANDNTNKSRPSTGGTTRLFNSRSLTKMKDYPSQLDDHTINNNSNNYDEKMEVDHNHHVQSHTNVPSSVLAQTGNLTATKGILGRFRSGEMPPYKDEKNWMLLNPSGDYNDEEVVRELEGEASQFAFGGSGEDDNEGMGSSFYFQNSTRKNGRSQRPSTSSEIVRSSSHYLNDHQSSPTSAYYQDSMEIASSGFRPNSSPPKFRPSTSSLVNTLRREASLKFRSNVDVNGRTAMQRREMNDKILLRNRIEDIKIKKERGMVNAAKDLEVKKLQKWMTVLVLVNHMEKFKEEFKNKKTYNQIEEMKKRSVKRIQRNWEIHYFPIRLEKKQKVQQALMKFSFRLLKRLADIRLRLAKRKVLQFYADFSRQRFSFVMVKFRFNCVKLQRRIRAFQECTRARLHVLHLTWNALEGQIRAKLEVEIDKDEGNVVRINSNNWKGKIQLARFPELARQVNKATHSTVELKKVIQKGISTVSSTLPVLKNFDPVKVQALIDARNAMKEGVSLRFDPTNGGASPERQGSPSRTRGKGAKKGGSSVAQAEGSLLSEKYKLTILRKYLVEQRTVHGDFGFSETRGADVEAKQVDIQAASAIMQGELDIRKHIDYTVTKKSWPTFRMLTKRNHKKSLIDLMEHHIREEILRKNKALADSVRDRLAAALKLHEENERVIKRQLTKGRSMKNINLESTKNNGGKPPGKPPMLGGAKSGSSKQLLKQRSQQGHLGGGPEVV